MCDQGSHVLWIMSKPSDIVCAHQQWYYKLPKLGSYARDFEFDQIMQLLHKGAKFSSGLSRPPCLIPRLDVWKGVPSWPLHFI
jgi:hypothetical protein